MTLLYLPLLEETLYGKEELTIVVLSALLLVISLLASSVNGIVIIPFLDVLLGCVIAFNVDGIREGFCSGKAFASELILICVLLPVSFFISVWGMASSSQIRTALAGQNFDLKKLSIGTYFIALVGLGSFGAIQAIMFI